MKKLNLILGATAAIVPATVLPLVCAQANNNQTENKNQDIAKTLSATTPTMVDADGWVKVDSEGKVKYHVIFDESTSPKSCTIDKLQANNGNSIVKWYPQGQYTKYNQTEVYNLEKIDTAKRCTGDGKIFLDLANANYLRYICNDAFNHTNNSKVRITWVNFNGAIRLIGIGDRAFKDQYFDRDDPNKMFDLAGTIVFEIGKEAFRGCCDASSKYQNVWAIIFPENLMVIGEQAFDSLNGKANNLIADKIIFTGYGQDRSTLCKDKNAWPKLTEKGSKEKSVMTQPGMASVYSEIYKGGGSSALGKPIVKDNFYESNIKFKKREIYDPPYMAYTLLGEAGKDTYKTLYPIVASTEEKATNTKAWLVGESGDHIWLESAGNDEYRIVWDSTLSSGLHRFNVVATQGEDENFSLTLSESMYVNVVDAKLQGGSSLVRASYASGQDANLWQVNINSEKYISWVPVSSQVITSNDKIKNAFHFEEEGHTYRFRLKWDNNAIDPGTYSIRIAQTMLIENTHQITVTQNVTLVIADTYYSMTIFDGVDPESGVLDKKTLSVDKADPTNQTYDINLYMFEGESIQQQELTEPKLSIPTSLKDAVTLIKEESGKYTIRLTLIKDGVQMLPIGSFQFYAYSTSKSTVLGKEVDYPVYSNSFTVEVKAKEEDTAYVVSGGTEDIIAFNKVDGFDVNSWALAEQNAATIKSVKISQNNWSSIDPKRLEHISAEIEETEKKSFQIKWDNRFASMDSWYQIVDMNIEIELETTSNDVATSIIQPLTISIKNSGDIQPQGGDTIYAYSNSTYTIPEPWKMYSNGSTESVSTSVDYWIDTTLTDPAIVENVSMQSDSKNPGQAYLSYTNLPVGTYDVYVDAYDYENVTTAQRKVTIYAGNILEIHDAPESLTFKRGNGKWEQPLTVTLNEQEYTSTITYTIDYVPTGTMYIDENNCLNWTSDLKEGQYAPTITAHIQTEDTVYSIPVEIQVVVEAAPTPEPSNAGVIAGATVGSVVGAGSIGANIGLGVKLSKAPKVKPRKSKKSKK